MIYFFLIKQNFHHQITNTHTLKIAQHFITNSNLLNLKMKNIFKSENIQKTKILGQGTYGKCYLVSSSIDNQLYVLKQIQVGGMNASEIQETMKQARILEALDHPNIVKCTEAYIENNTLNIFMDYADGGDLSKKIKNAKGFYFSENQVLNWFTQICLALKHVHDRKIIHRDLKCQNIFLTSENIVKLGDFGIAKPLQLTLQKIKTVVGTPYYMSPQICQNKQYSLKTDIWSLGVILFQMCALKPPFDANSLPALALKITRGQYGTIPSHYSKQIRKLISDLLQVDPAKRPTINEVLKFNLLKSRIDAFLPQGIRQRQFSHTTLHSQNIFQRQDLKKQISKLANQQPQLSLIVSPRNGHHPGLFFPSQTPQNKGNAIQSARNKQLGSNLKQKNPFEKRKKPQTRKRQISEPTLTPRANQKKLKSNTSLTNLQRKKSDKEKNNFFKKKKIPQQLMVNCLSEIKQDRDFVKELDVHCRQLDSKNQFQINPAKMINNYIKEESEEEEQINQDCSSSSEENYFQSEQSLQPSKKVNQLSQTLEKLLIEIMGEKQLTKCYCQIQENQGIILNERQQNKQKGLSQPKIKNQGLISLLYGINNFLIA